jgi:hypothetical protein
MALYPCDVGAHRYRGAQQTIYPALTDGVTTLRRKLRLCEEHFAAALETIAQRAHNADRDFDDTEGVKCLLCAQFVIDAPHAFFATVYRAKSEREDWWAPVHAACFAVVARDWHLHAEGP